MTDPTITVPAPLFRALFAAAQMVCNLSVHHSYRVGTVVPADLITDLRAALEPLKEVGATPAQALDRRYRSDAP
jgi:hypothetical protein